MGFSGKSDLSFRQIFYDGGVKATACPVLERNGKESELIENGYLDKLSDLLNGELKMERSDIPTQRAGLKMRIITTFEMTNKIK